MSSSFTNQTLAQLELWKERTSGKYARGRVYVLPKVRPHTPINQTGEAYCPLPSCANQTHASFPPLSFLPSQVLDEKVARLHLGSLGVELTELRPDQAEYIGVPLNGPYKPETYRY